MKTIIFDTETTGIDEPALVEAAYLDVAFDDKEETGIAVLNSFERRYNPGKPISYGAMATHHITDEMVANCDPASSFALPDGVEYIIGHNVDFDWRVIGEPDILRICTLAMCRTLWPEVDSHSQLAMLYFFDRRYASTMAISAHSAIIDTDICLSLLEEIIKKTRIDDMESLWSFSEQCRIPTVMTFGKHKGDLISDIPRDYKQWLLRQPDVDPYLVIALTK